MGEKNKMKGRMGMDAVMIFEKMIDRISGWDGFDDSEEEENVLGLAVVESVKPRAVSGMRGKQCSPARVCEVKLPQITPSSSFVSQQHQKPVLVKRLKACGLPVKTSEFDLGSLVGQEKLLRKRQNQ